MYGMYGMYGMACIMNVWHGLKESSGWDNLLLAYPFQLLPSFELSSRLYILSFLLPSFSASPPPSLLSLFSPSYNTSPIQRSPIRRSSLLVSPFAILVLTYPPANAIFENQLITFKHNPSTRLELIVSYHPVKLRPASLNSSVVNNQSGCQHAAHENTSHFRRIDWE